MKEAQARIDESIERIGAKAIASIVPVTAGDVDGVATVRGDAVQISARFALEAQSDLLDQVIAHEMFHAILLHKDKTILTRVNEISLKALGMPEFDPDSALGRSVIAFSSHGSVPRFDPDKAFGGNVSTFCSRESWDKVTKILKDADAVKNRR